jgi:hypothetical protein
MPWLKANGGFASSQCVAFLICDLAYSLSLIVQESLSRLQHELADAENGHAKLQENHEADFMEAAREVAGVAGSLCEALPGLATDRPDAYEGGCSLMDAHALFQLQVQSRLLSCLT